ncbi:hypothetical protein M011DRAFT_484898 [Sporormia fimetaria CBS 119925]|uniref:Uncharacterized protein n=1 Tax=Sporormia fimetaria CBS 119925 TaxID=1340428 RepID=A0A6A6VI27_9PLEO|nr:hypothetical protein M011DRAFT_484898 [Sporormia fimetaria CBS 119925]
MGKPGFGIFQNRRKSSGNIFDQVDPPVLAGNSPLAEQGGGFRVLNRAEIEKAKLERQEAALKKAHDRPSKFGRFPFGSSGSKGRTQSVDEISPASSKRYVDPMHTSVIVMAECRGSESKSSSSGTHSFISRPYHGGGSSSTLPSSAESDPSDNMFSALPQRPQPSQHNSSPSALSMAANRKDLPPPPFSVSRTSDGPGRVYRTEDSATTRYDGGRARAMTTSSYASTAVAPKLDADLDFGGGDFGENMFAGFSKKEPPEMSRGAVGQIGHSLTQGRRTFQSEPIRIDRNLDIEPPPKSWDSRSSGEHLISPPAPSSPPPPPPPHKWSQYAPVASDSPELNGSPSEDEGTKLMRQSLESRKSTRDSSVEPSFSSQSMSSAMSAETPLSSASISLSDYNNPKIQSLPLPSVSPLSDHDEELFGAPTALNGQSSARTPTSTTPSQHNSVSFASTRREPPRRVMSATEFHEQQRRRTMYQESESGESENYDDDEEDEEEAIRRREEEQKILRKRQQLQIAREHMRRSTAPTDMQAANGFGAPSNGFPSEASLQADEWSDEDVPLEVLKQHGFPTRNRPPTQPTNAMPSYFRSDSTTSLPDRPSSTGAMGNRMSSYKPPFARNLPDDPYAGNGLVQQPIRMPMGFNRPASVFNEPMNPIPLEAQPTYTSLVDQIQMRDNAKQKYMGGASSKTPTSGPFTGTLGGQMNATNGNNKPNRMSQMPQMGMNGMNGMGMNGMNGMNPMMMNMMAMGMNPMGFPMYPQNELMMQQMYQQMLAFQNQNAMLAQQQQDPRMSMMAQQQDPRMSMMPQQQDPRMSMMHQQQDPRMSMMPQQNLGFPNQNFLNPGAGMPNQQQRPMSFMSAGQNRPMSTMGVPPMPGFQQPMGAPTLPAGYTPSIAPSERSNIGLSPRYRPVATGNGMNDTRSTVGSSNTLQASGGAPNAPKIKGILKPQTPRVTVQEAAEDGWGDTINSRKSKFLDVGLLSKKSSTSSLQEVVKAIEKI